LQEKLLFKILKRVEKPGRYTGGEPGTIIKKFSPDKTRVVLVYPDLYDVGMSYFGFQIIYHILNKSDDIIAERAYAPWIDFEKELRKKGLYLFSLETRTPIRDFDIVGFNLSYELTYTNILNLLELSGISIFSKHRRDDEPIIVAGGAGAFNPEPLASFIDIFFIGDAEESIVDFIKTIGKLKRQQVKRKDIFRELVSKYSNLYIPALYKLSREDDQGYMVPIPIAEDVPEKIKASKTPTLKPFYYPESPILPIVEISQDRLTFEVMRGCTRGCRFCMAGFIYRPVRERSHRDIMNQVTKVYENTGHGEISLLSLSSSDYTGLHPLIQELYPLLAQKKLSLSLPSLRLESFSDLIARALQETRKSGITFAPEAGSERLRRVVNKYFSDDEILRDVEIALSYRWRVLKLYFMIGLPSETYDDLEAIYTLLEHILKAGKGKLTLNVTISNFIPKPFTPFQWERQNPPEELQAKIDYIKPMLRKLKKVKIMTRNPYYSLLEGVISRGDRRIADIIYEAWKQGARFDSWKECFSWEKWETAFTKVGIKPSKYLEERDTNRTLPWEVIDAGISKNFLFAEREKAFKGEISRDCREGCIGCGVCNKQIKMVYDNEKKVTITKGEPPKLETKEKDEEHVYRIRFSRDKRYSFYSHFDITKLLYFALRRSGLKLSYSKGFSQKPKISFGFPLPFGCTSEAEYADIYLLEECKDIEKILNKYLPDGLKVIESVEIEKGSSSVYSSVKGFIYVINFEGKVPEQVRSKLTDILSRHNFPIERTYTKKKGTKIINARKFLGDVKIEDNSIHIELRVDGGRTLRMDELLDMLNIKIEDVDIHRKEVLFLNNR